MLPNLPSQSEPMQESHAVLSNSELSCEDFGVPANNPALGQITLPFMAMTSLIISAQSLLTQTGLVAPCQGARKLNSDRKLGATK